MSLINSFLTYLLLMLIIVAVCAVAFCIAQKLRMKKDTQNNKDEANE